VGPPPPLASMPMGGRRLFPYKRHVFRSVRLPYMTTGLTQCLPSHPPFKVFESATGWPLQSWPVPQTGSSCRLVHWLGYGLVVLRSVDLIAS